MTRNDRKEKKKTEFVQNWCVTQFWTFAFISVSPFVKINFLNTTFWKLMAAVMWSLDCWSNFPHWPFYLLHKKIRVQAQDSQNLLCYRSRIALYNQSVIFFRYNIYLKMWFKKQRHYRNSFNLSGIFWTSSRTN